MPEAIASVFTISAHYWGNTIITKAVQCGPGNWEVYLGITDRGNMIHDCSLVAANARSLSKALLAMADAADELQGRVLP